MPDKLIPLTIPAGIVRNGTKYQSKGTWYDAQLVRFAEKTIKPMGGWRLLRKDDGSGLAPLEGIPRAVVAWRTDGGDTFIVIATTDTLYCFAGGVIHDITPVGFVGGSEDTAPSTTSGTYGAGAYGTGAYGVGASASTMVEASLWQLDNFGDYLVAASTADSKLYGWAGDILTLPSEITGVGVGAPESVTGVVVTPERFLVALGVDGNVRKLQWADQETTSGWDISAPSATTGDFELTTDGRLVCGARTKGETLLWTDTDLHAMRYIGGTLIYQFVLLGEKCGIISPRAKVTFDTRAMWMGRRNFFGYDGYVQPMECPVHDYVFGDFNEAQAVKVWAQTIAEFGEVWFYYPSAGSMECDRYVIYNYRENHWNIGKLRRAAGLDAGALSSPLMISPTGEVFEHELPLLSRPAVAGETVGFYILTEDGGIILLENGGGLMTEEHHPYLESGPIEIGEGDRLMNVQRLVPDEKTRGQVLATFFGTNYPTEAEVEHGPYDMSNISNVRFKARQARIRLDENQLVDWRVGILRLGVRESDRR